MSSSLSLFCLAEFIGVFIVIYVVLYSRGNAYAIVAALAAVIIVGSLLSFPMFVNPAISFICFMNSDIILSKFISCLIAEISGGLLALAVYRVVTAAAAGTN